MDAAAEVFAARGYERATLEDVAAAAGLTKGAVYSNFPGKEELFFALMKDRVDERLALASEAVTRQATAAGAVSDAGGELAALISAESDWHLLFIEFWARAVRDPRISGDFARKRRTVRASIAAFLEEQAAREDVDLPAPADQLAVVVLALSNGVAIEHLADPENVDPSVLGVALGLLLGRAP